MPFRASFDCLWCGRRHVVRTPEDLEGWASLCPDCLGRAQENGFLRTRLRTALRERAASAMRGRVPSPMTSSGPMGAPGGDRSVGSATDCEDWYGRRGPSSSGPVHDLPWQMELDTVTGWLDELPLGGRIVEPAAGTGWWSPLLAARGELWLFDRDAEALELARERLLAHGLRAHLHQRGPFETRPEDQPADVLFTAFLLGELGDGHLGAALTGLRARLRPGGLLAIVECRPLSLHLGAPGPRVMSPPEGRDVATEGQDLIPRPLAMVRGPRGLLRARTAVELMSAIVSAGFSQPRARETPTSFIMMTATAPGWDTSSHDGPA